MEFTGSPITEGRTFTVLGPIAYVDEVVLILQGEHIVQYFSRQNICETRIERRPSFKSPILGLLFAALFIGIPISVFGGDPFGIDWLVLGSLYHLGGWLIMIAFGIYLIYMIATAKEVDWLIITRKQGEREYLLHADVDEKVRKFVAGLPSN